MKRKKFKFEDLEVWKISLDLSDMVYNLVDKLPAIENFNLKSQAIRSSTSISLNIAEGSTGASNSEQIRYLNIAIHSLIEFVACLRLIERRKYVEEMELYTIDDKLNTLFAKLNAFVRALR